MAITTTLRKLAQTFGPSGHEDAVRDVLRRAIEPLADDLRTDALGNLIARKTGAGSGGNVMLVAHMDEIGVMV
ncbi:MAG: M42 family peptidase, partial [Lentisphaeria bacterium]|nr:M42 family peptidase [Lentisphaeria bacterium]